MTERKSLCSCTWVDRTLMKEVIYHFSGGSIVIANYEISEEL